MQSPRPIFNKTFASRLLVVAFSGVVDFSSLITRQFASSARSLSGFGALRFIIGDAVRQPLAGVDHGLVSVLRSQTLQQGGEERHSKVGCPHKS
jgi:hypothetical protein